MKTRGKTFKQLFASVERQQRERIRKAGKHACIKTGIGVARRVTRQDGEPLKRPVVIMRFYECKICGRGMSQSTA